MAVRNQHAMKFTKLGKGRIQFEGIDNWNNQPISGEIIYQPLDVLISQVWQVRFYINGSMEGSTAEYFGKSAKDCKQWLTN